MPISKWKLRIEPFAELYSRLDERIMFMVRELDDDALTQLYEDTAQPTQTNCGWAVYRVAPMVRENVYVEQQRRTREDGA